MRTPGHAAKVNRLGTRLSVTKEIPECTLHRKSARLGAPFGSFLCPRL